MRLIFIKIILFVTISILKCDLIQTAHNFTNWSSIRRHRRGLIFNGGGIAKFVGGGIYPLYLEDKVHWRQVNCLYNFQAQYTAPDTPLYWWDKWNEGRSFITNFINSKFKINYSKKYLTIVPDDTRKFVYLALENFMNSKNKNGKKCLLRAICENGQIMEHFGIFSEFLNILLKPGNENIDSDYKDAYIAGMSGANCLSLFPECPQGDSLFDSLAVTL